MIYFIKQKSKISYFFLLTQSCVDFTSRDFSLSKKTQLCHHWMNDKLIYHNTNIIKYVLLYFMAYFYKGAFFIKYCLLKYNIKIRKISTRESIKKLDLIWLN